jgi:hypothetical protein
LPKLSFKIVKASLSVINNRDVCAESIVFHVAQLIFTGDQVVGRSLNITGDARNHTLGLSQFVAEPAHFVLLLEFVFERPLEAGCELNDGEGVEMMIVVVSHMPNLWSI